MFAGVLIRVQVVAHRGWITAIYGPLYDVVRLLRYGDGNLAPRYENFSHAYRIFFHGYGHVVPQMIGLIELSISASWITSPTHSYQNVHGM